MVTQKSVKMTHSVAEQRRVADATDLCNLLRKSVAKSIINLVIIIIFVIFITFVIVIIIVIMGWLGAVETAGRIS